MEMKMETLKQDRFVNCTQDSVLISRLQMRHFFYDITSMPSVAGSHLHDWFPGILAWTGLWII